jgi:hypothetical protein
VIAAAVLRVPYSAVTAIWMVLFPSENAPEIDLQESRLAAMGTFRRSLGVG